MDSDRDLAIDVAVGLIAAALRSWKHLGDEPNRSTLWMDETVKYLRLAYAVAKDGLEGRQ